MLAGASAAHEDSPLAALATAAADGGLAETELEGMEAQEEATAAANASVLRQSSRTTEAGAHDAGVAAPLRRKRAAEAVPAPEEGPPQKKAALAADGKLAALADAITTGGRGGRTQRCTGCAQTKPLDAFYKVRLLHV